MIRRRLDPAAATTGGLHRRTHPSPEVRHAAPRRHRARVDGRGLGENRGVAASVAILFRILTFWVQIPVGWVAMRGLVRRGLL